MVHRIEDPHDLAVDADGAGDPDLLPEGPRDPLGNARLAVARRAEEEQPAAGVHRRSEPIEHPLAEHEIAEGLAEVFGRGLLPGQRLGLDARDVVFQRNRGGAEVGAVVPVALGPFAAQIGELVQKSFIGARRDRPTNWSFFKPRSSSSMRMNGSLSWSAISRPVASPRASKILQGQRLDEAVVQAGGLERLRFLGNKAVGRQRTRRRVPACGCRRLRRGAGGGRQRPW